MTYANMSDAELKRAKASYLSAISLIGVSR
jgi:hypothetical protein